MGFERAKLKTEIAARDAAEARVEGARKALDRIGDQIFDGQKRLRELRAERAEEASDRVRRIVAGGSAVLERVNGRQREGEIEEEIVALKEARDLCKGALAEAEASLEFKKRRVAEAVGAVIAGAAPQLIAATEAAKRDFDGRAAVLKFIHSSLGEAHRRQAEVAIAYPTGFDLLDHPALAPWRKAAEALGRDGDAPVPQ